MRDVVLCSAVRTPVGKFLGGLKDKKAPELGAVVVREALRRAGVDPARVDEVILGNVLQAGVGQNPARQAAVKAGLPLNVPAFTVNKVCGSGMKSVMLAAQAIKAGDADVIVAGGMESMSNAPHLLLKAREGYRIGNGELVDAMQWDGLVDAFSGIAMGITGEIVAEEFRVTRREADAFAERSHRLAQAATGDGLFKDEIVPVDVGDKKGPRVVERDEGIRPDTNLETLGRLRPSFKPDGVVTAGNASQISDGAAALVVAGADTAREHGWPVLAKIGAYGAVGVEPQRVMAAPIYGVRKLLEKQRLRVADLDLVEHNEAFATASCAVRNECAIPEDRFNTRGGAVALGHPLGASGARVLTTLVHALQQEGKHRGLATLCLGGGNAVTMIVERA